MLTLLFLFSALSAVGADIPVGTNRVLMVNQDGVINIPAVLATQAQISSNQAAVVIADAKASAAMEAARESSNIVSEVVQQIAEQELVIYRQGYIDSITSDVGLPPGTRCIVTRMEAAVARTGSRVEHRLTYAVTSPADSVLPDVLWSATPDGGRDAMMPLPAADIGIPVRVGGAYTGQDGTSYPYQYRVSFFTAPAEAGFFIVYLAGDASDASAVFAISGGISGGVSTVAIFGDKKLTFRGGLLVGVEEVAP